MDLSKIYFDAIMLARAKDQTVGEKKDYYITIEQLERLLIKQQNETNGPTAND